MKNVIIIGGGGINHANSAAKARVQNYAKCLSQNPEVFVYIISVNQDNLSTDFEKNDSNSFYELKSKQTPHKESVSTIWNFLNSLKSRIPHINDACFILYPQANCIFETIFLIWCKVNRIKNIFCEINEVRRYWSALENFGNLKKLYYKSIFNISERYASSYKGLICINKNISQFYERYNQNSYIIPILSPIDNYIPKRNYNTSNPLSITFTGTIDIEKENLKELLIGLSKLKNEISDNWILNLYGTINQDNKTRLQNIASEYGITDKLVYHGSKPQSDIPDILKNSDCLILSRQNNLQNYYGFSTKLSEYLVSGTPVILTKTGVVADYLTDGVDCIFIQGYSAEDFKNAFNRLLSLTDSDRQNMAKNAYNTATTYFSPEKYSKSFLQFLFS